MTTPPASDALERIRGALASDPRVWFGMLFGSRAAGRARPDSDWDIAVFLDPALAPTERSRVAGELYAGLAPRDPVQFVVLNDSPPLLAQRALQGEKLLVRDQTAFVRFFVRTQALAGDESYYREIHARARRRRLEEGTFGRP